MSDDKMLFEKLKKQLMMIDPVHFCQSYLTLDGKQFRLEGNGYRPFADIYRYIGVKALEPTAKPVIMVKGRQVGATTMASALEMYFMGSGIFGVGDKPPMRIIHAFPQLELAAAYSKTKLNQMISASVLPDAAEKKSASKIKSYMQSLMDNSTSTGDSLTFKQFINGNHLWVESVGLDGDRVMGKTADVIFFDECFPYNQCIEIKNGKRTIGSLYLDYVKNKELPLVKSFNEKNNSFEYKKITNIWKIKNKQLVCVKLGSKKIKCTPNHLFLTENGWKAVSEISEGTLIKSAIGSNKYIRALNDDQLQVVLGSFLGDGHLDTIGKSRYRLRINHGIKQKDYCQWKANLFGSKIKSVENNGFSKKPAIGFSSATFGLHNYLPSKKKNCPQWLLDKLDARGLAIWFMDDGSLNKKWNEEGSATISTNDFDEDSQKRFVEKFNSFGITCHYKKYDYYSLYFNKDNYKKLCKLINPYIHDTMTYKIISSNSLRKYNWNDKFENYCWSVLDKIINNNEKDEVYDIEVEDNHNFILAPNTRGTSSKFGGPIVHNCQKTTGMAIGNSLKVLTTAKYGKPSKGVQVYFGTPRRKGSDFHKMWQTSSQQYYYLGCGKCKEHFPLYTPGSDDWEKIWLYGYVVKCTHCGYEQDKREAAERGKWVSLKNLDDEDCLMVGFHINQLYMPIFTKEDIINEKAGIHPINTERVYKNEVLGEFYQGDASPISPEEIRELCGDERKFKARIEPDSDQIVVLGIDYGARADLEQLANPERAKPSGQSYSTAVVMSSKGSGLLAIEFATKFKRNDPESKKGLIDQLMRQYSIQLAIGDIGFSNDFSYIMHSTYGDKYLVSRAHSKVNNHVKFSQDSFPKEIIFERDYYISECYEQMRKGQIRFPFGDYEKLAWLIEHCSSMEIKPSISAIGEHSKHYIKGGTPNDGFMALLNAYIAYKFILTKGFSIYNPYIQQKSIKELNKPLIISGYVPRKF